MNKNNTLVFTLLLIYAVTHTAEDTNLFLQQIASLEDPNSAQQKIRLNVCGDQNACLTLFKTAVEKDNAAAQLYCATAHLAMLLDNDAEKDFSALQQKELESYNFIQPSPKIPRPSMLLDCMYVSAGLCAADEFSVQRKLTMETLSRAAQAGNAFGTLLYIDRQSLFSDPHFGHACKMRSIIKDGKFPFPEAALAFKRATQNMHRHRPDLKTIPDNLLDLFDHHDMKQIQSIIEDGWLKAYERGNHLILHNSCKLDFSMNNEEVIAHATYVSKIDETELVPVIAFLKDAYARCRNYTDLVGIINDLLHE